MKLLQNTLNPFMNIAINIANNKNGFDKSSFALIEFLLKYEHFHDFDINEQFLVIDSNANYYQKSNSYFTNFFNTIFILEQSFNPQLINKLVDCGLKFNPFFTNEKKENVGDILFTRTELNSDRNIFLFNLYLKQNGIKDFTEKVIAHNTLHKCIAQKQLKTAEFLLKHVSIDTKNENLETPIMYAKDLISLEFLSKYNPFWGQKDILGNDCSFFFSGIQNDDLKKDMLNFYLSSLLKDIQSSNEDPLYVNKRLEETLIQLVSKDATKIELQTFLKKYKIQNPDKLTNINNRTLGHICVANEDFARFSLFPNTDLYHIDNNGYNIFVSLFNKKRFSSDTKNKNAKNILLECLKNPEKNITQKSFNRLIKIPFNSYSSDSLPDWILQDHSLRIELFKAFKISSNEVFLGNYMNKSSSLTSAEKNKIFFDLLGNLIKDYEIPILNKENMFKNMFTKKAQIYEDSNEFFFNKYNSENFILLLEKCDNVGKINLEQFLDNFLNYLNPKLLEIRDSFMVSNKEIYENPQELIKANNKEFYEKVCAPFFEFLNEYKLFHIIKGIDEDLINQTLKTDNNGDLNDFLKTYTYLKLNDKLSNKNIKNKNIKI